MTDDELNSLKSKVFEWEEEADFLVNNSVGSDIAVGNTYSKCAKELTKLIKSIEEAPNDHR